MGEPLSPDRVFDFPMDESEPHPAYDFFAPGPLPGYAGNPNNNNGWIEADVSLLGELGAEADEPMVGPVVGKIVEPIVEMEEQVIAPVIDIEEDIAMLFGDDDFGDDNSEGFKDEEELVKKVILVSDAEVADGITLGEIGPRVSEVEGQDQQAATQRDEVITGLTQMVQTLQAAVKHIDSQIQQLQTMVSEMSSRESTLMQCILGMDRRLADLERRPPGP
ncbi:hypothetical protein Tco_0832115 [Tanacetum coccineum]